MRTLATVQTIKSLEAIPEKDKIVLASFENTGWHVIVGKDDNLKVGDRCIYIEYDSVLPEWPEYEFLRKRCWNEKWKGFRIRNMKMGGVYSEGIVFPLTLITIRFPRYIQLSEGMDVTDVLEIVKYDPEAMAEKLLLEEIERRKKKYPLIIRFLLKFAFFRDIMFPRKKTNWPVWAHHSDETRVQVLPYVYDQYIGTRCYATEKIDGQSALFGVNKREFAVCSRNLRLPEPTKLKGMYIAEKFNYWLTAQKYDIEAKLRKAQKEMGIDLYVQGEQCGPGISENKYGFTELKFFVFNIFDITHKKYFGWNDILTFCVKYEFFPVYLLEVFDFHFNNIDELVNYSKGNSFFAPIPREGVVIRSLDPMPPGNGMANMMSFKVINPDFALKYGI